MIKGHPESGTKGIGYRQARVLRDRLAVDLRMVPARGNQSPCLGEFLRAYLDSRTDLKPGTLKLHDMTCRYLTAHFGEDVRIARIDRATAREWRIAHSAGT